MKIDVPALFSMWNSGVRQLEICQKLGIRPGTFWRLRQKYALPAREVCRWSRARPTPDPTLEEIVERAAAIRATWSEEEAARRVVGRGVEAVQIKAYSYDHRRMAFALD